MILESLPALLKGAFLSLVIASSSCAIGLSLGTALALVQTESRGWASRLVSLYVALFRGTPMLVQILFLFYLLPSVGIALPALWTAVVAIGLNSSAYTSQVVRTGIEAVESGQREAAMTLGLSRLQITLYVTLPQAFRTILPTLGNEFATLIKDSSLASVIGVMELTKQASIIRSQSYDPFAILFATTLIYLAMTSVVGWFLRKKEKGYAAA